MKHTLRFAGRPQGQPKKTGLYQSARPAQTHRPQPRGWLLTLLLTLLSGGAALAQAGKDGALTVSSSGQVVNTYGNLVAGVAAGVSSVEVPQAFYNSLTAGGGDLVMLIQMQGATISTANDATYGQITSYGGAGNYEVKEVASTTTSGNGSNRRYFVNFNCALNNAYSASGSGTQVIRIPRYSTLTFTAGTSTTARNTITAPAWNGSTGGVVAVEVSGSVTIRPFSGFVADGLGFRGGTTSTNTYSAGGGPYAGYVSTTDNSFGGQQGESIAGRLTAYGRGAPANGGGGGNSHNAAGGGGANVGSGPWTGNGNPDRGPGNAYDAAWNLEGAGFATSTSAGGGRGGYTYSANAVNPTTNAPGSTAWGGDNRNQVGGLGGRPLDVSGGRLFLGGGGGGASANDGGVGVAVGGNGGGIIWLAVRGNVTSDNNTSAVISAAGANAPSINYGSSSGDAMGGAGGGGAVLLNVAGSVSSGLISVAGGVGGTQTIGTNEAEGGGGGGGGGYLAYTNVGSTTSLVTSGGANGTTTSLGVNSVGTAFPPNGATRGGTGVAAALAAPLGVACVQPLTGYVFEDVNYGGGLGRPRTAAGAAPVGGVTVELYNSSGALVGTTQTNASGQYSFFSVSPNTSYTVRVVNSTVGSTRPGAVAGLLPVQTFNGTTDRVGGENPARTDALANSGSQTLASLTPTTGTTAAQSLATFTTSTSATAANAGPDFGFNFSTIVNTNDAGQGSLRQFITNSNALTNAGLAQAASSVTGSVAPAAGVETSIFMIPRGAATDGIRAAVPSQLTGGVAVIQPASALPAITDANTALDARTQAQNVGNTNTAVLAAATTVGTQGTALPAFNGPEVQITGNSGINVGLQFNSTAAGGTVAGLAIYGFTPSGGYPYNQPADAFGNIRIDASNVTVTANVIGTTATSFTDPGATARTNLSLLTVTGGTGTQITNNLIGFGNSRGVFVMANGASIGATTGAAGASQVTVSGNRITATGQVNTNLDGTDLQGSGGNTVTGNLYTANASSGVDSYGNTGATNNPGNALYSNVISGNTISNNGVGNGSGVAAEPSAVRLYGARTLVSQNVISNNYGSGIMGTYDTSNPNNTGTASYTSATTISQNSIFGNGSILSANSSAASGAIGIDLTVSTDNQSTGTSPYVTRNNANGTTGANGLVNYPILQTAQVVGANLVVSGFAKPGAVIELFLASPNPSTPNALGANFGQGQSFLITVTEGSPADADTRTGQTYSSSTTSFDQGSDTNANGFRFSIPLSSLTADQQAALTGGTARLTSTATLGATATTPGATSEFSGNVAVVTPADLATTIGGPTAVLAGQPSGTYTATFTNLGPNATTGATRTVTVPAGSTFTPAQTTAITNQGGSISGTTINFGTTGTLASGASSTFTFAFTAPPTAGNVTVVSTVGPGSGTADLNTTNNAATLNVSVAPVSDVVANITGSGNTAAGATGTFTATFTNNGPSSPAAGVVATVQLPAGLGTVTFSGTTAGVTPSYDNGTGVVSFTGTPITALAQGAPVATTISYTQPVNSPSVTATAAISTTTNEAGQTANNSASATNSTTRAADVATTIGGPATVAVGGQATYNLTSQNNGPQTATNVVQTATLPSGLPNVFVTNGGTYNSGTGVVTFPAISLAPNQVVSNSVSFTAPGTATTSYSVVANITATQDPATTGNNTATTSTSVVTPAGSSTDLAVTLAASGTSVAASSTVTFTLTQTNNGPNPATGVATTLSLPPGLTVATLTLPATTSVQLGNVITFTSLDPRYNNATYNASTGVLTFPTVATQNPGLAAATGNVYTVNVTAPATGVLSATAAVRGANSDPIFGNNLATAQTTVTTTNSADVATTLTGPDAAAPGSLVSYVVTTVNNGPAAASNVVQTVTIPAGLPISGTNALTIGGAAPTSTSGSTATYAGGVTYNAATGVVTYPAVASFANGTSQRSVITYSAPANGGAALGNVARVSSGSTDANLTNNAATVSTALTPTADVQVALTGPTTATAGNQVIYGVTTTNNGPSVAPSVTTTVQLPAGLSNVVVRDAAGNVVANSATTGYNATTGLVTLPSLTNQATGGAGAAAFTIALPVPAAGQGPLVPTAVASVSGATDPTLTNNAASVATDVQPTTTARVDLSIALSTTTPTVTPGQQVIINATLANLSGTSASGVVARAQLPAGLTSNGGTVTVQVAGVTIPGAYDNATGLVSYTASAPLGANQTVPGSITISQAPGSGPLVAVGFITSNEADADLSNNVSTTSTTITPGVSVATAVTGPASASAGQSVSYTVVTSNPGLSPTANTTQTLTIPAGVTSYSLNGGAAVSVTGPATVSIPVPASLSPGASVTNVVSFTAPTASYTVTGVAGATGASNSTGSQPTAIAPAVGPVANNVVNNNRQPMSNNTPVALPISSLSAQGGTGALTYQITALPPVSQGVLFLANGTTAVTTSTLLDATQAANLTFRPNANFVGNATFTYTATDANGSVSNPATYLVPVNSDQASAYTVNASKGGAAQYQSGDEIARVFDPNGGVATTPTFGQADGAATTYGINSQPNTSNGRPGNVPTNGLASATTSGIFSSTPFPGVINNLSDLGLVFNTTARTDPTTGQVFTIGQITVGDRTKLRRGTYTLSVTTTDVFGGVTTQPVTFTIGANPLPVSLTVFTATAQGADARLAWTTASETNNDRFEVERSLDGSSFVKIGQVAGQGSKLTPTDYTLTDAGVARLAAGGPVYYRLRQVDLDGTAAFSPVRTVSFPAAALAGPPSLSLYPNPASSRATLDLANVPAGSYRVTLFDLAGRAVRELKVETATRTQDLNLSELASGTYHVVLTGTRADGQALRLSQRLTKE